MAAAADDYVYPSKTYIIMFTIYSIACAISAISVLALLFAILRHPKVRSNTFNLYLVFCLTPDAVYFLVQLGCNLLQLAHLIKFVSGDDYFLSERGVVALVYIDTWSQYFWICGSLWMSFSVFVQIYKLLTANKQTKRYQPPTRKRVIIDSTIILIISGIVAASITVLWWVYENEETWANRAYLILNWTGYIPVLVIPTLLLTGMCFGVWWNNMLPRKNARYRSLTMFFARLLASAYLMAIGYSIEISSYYWPRNSDKALNIWNFSKSIFYLFGLFQVCLSLTKKDIRDAFVDMCCCRKQDNGVTRSSTAGRPAGEESYEPEADGYDVEPSTVNDVTALVENSASVENSTVLKEDVYPCENDDIEVNTSSFVESFEQKRTVVEDGDDAKLEGAVVEDVDDAIAVVTVRQRGYSEYILSDAYYMLSLIKDHVRSDIVCTRHHSTLSSAKYYHFHTDTNNIRPCNIPLRYS